MPDLLVNLLKLPSLAPVVFEAENAGIVIRRAQAFEITSVLEFVEGEFSVPWADEISVGFANKPVSVFIATCDKEVVGCSAYECTRRGFFGPMGVTQELRDRGIGNALLIAGLWGLRELGYVYAIIGGVGPVEFYEKTVGAVVIADSEPGVYTDLLNGSTSVLPDGHV